MSDDRREIAKRLVMLHVKHAAVFAEIDDLKERLRVIAEKGGEGFKEEFPKGFVQVSGGSEAKFKGVLPVLDPDAFLDLPETRREELIAGKVIAMERQYTKASRPSVTVKL